VSGAVVDHSPVINQPNHLAPRDMLELSFEEAVRKFACHRMMKNGDSTASTTIQQQVSATNQVSKELWQSLAQKHSPKAADPDPADKSDSTEGLKVGASVAKDGSESGDGSSNTSACDDPAITRQTKCSVVARSAETGAGDAKSVPGGGTVSPHGWAGWQTVDRDRDGPTAQDEESISETGVVDSSTADVSGEESFYSVTSGDQHLTTQSPPQPAAGPAHDDDDDDDDEEESSDDNNDDAAHVMQTQAESGMNNTYAAFHWAQKLVFPNSYLRVGSRGCSQNSEFPDISDFSGTIFPTGKLVNTSFRAQWNAALLTCSFKRSALF